VQGGTATAGRKRAAVELVAREDAGLRRTARRYSICEDDAEDAYQRALEILLVKAPSERPRELSRWMRTVVKHEALAIRRHRERMLGVSGGEEEEDPIARLAAVGAGPDESAERREQVARSREALQALKPAELRALTLLAAGCSYAEIGRITGFSQTKINRCLAEGRERFRRLLTRSESGERCAELAPLLSAFCDGESRPEDETALREHLRACAGCRATLRAYRATPAAVAALAPALPVSRSLLERAQEALIGLQVRIGGRAAGDEAGMTQVAAAGGTRGAGMAALAKALAICAGTVGGGVACVAAGVVPTPLDPAPRTAPASIERVSEGALEGAAPPVVEYQPAAEPEKSKSDRPRGSERQRTAEAEHAVAEPATEAAAAGAVEDSPPPPEPPQPTHEPAAPPPAESSGASSDSAAGEFGP
jgi:RNA polymerase sigma factor (sigma-70 family)